MPKGFKHSDKANEKKSLTTAKLWQNDEYREKQKLAQTNAWKNNTARINKQKERMKRFWLEITDEQRKEMHKKSSAKLKGRIRIDMQGDNNPAKRLEVRKKIKLARKRRKEKLGYMNSPAAREKQRQKTLEQFKDGMPQETKDKIRIGQFRHPRKYKDTSIEIKIQHELLKRNIKFEKQKPLLNKYLVDIFIAPNIVIECDGDYWHNLPGAQEKDLKRDKELIKNNYVVYRFWQHEINDSPEKCINQLSFLC